jgi:rfaE bifunctional protein kinase chain/domain
MLTEELIRQILNRLPDCSIGVVGDFFLDKYLDIDGRLTEKSVETDLDAYQVVRVRTSPGAGGTVTNNLAALGVGRIYALTLIGEDGEGFELRRELSLRGIDMKYVIDAKDRFTPTYTKPLLRDGAGQLRELNRLDIKNRRPVTDRLVKELGKSLIDMVHQCDAVIVADQVSEPNCGVVTDELREQLARLGERYPNKAFLADSRERIGQFRNVITKPNRSECLRTAVLARTDQMALAAVESAARGLARITDRPVYCTLGENGILYVDSNQARYVAAYAVNGPVDVVGAGDSTTAGIVCALCAEAEPVDAAAFGNLIASITVQQLGTTGTAKPEQVIERWRKVLDARPTNGD